MSELSKKYGVSEQAIKALVKDGWITCNAPQYEEIYYQYKQHFKNTGCRSEAINITASYTNVSQRWVYEIIKRFE